MTKHNKHTNDHCWTRLPVYRSGGRLSAEQLTAEQENADKRERLLNLALHGWGVVHGYDVAMNDKNMCNVEVKDGCIHIGCGLALDPRGRTLYRDTGYLHTDDIVGKVPDKEGCYTLKAHYAEKSDAGSWDPCLDGSDWVHQCVVFSLTPCCETYDICPRCQPDDTCAPRRDYVCARTGQSHGKKWQDPDLNLACEAPPPLKSTKCGKYQYDLDAGIPLVCVEICDLTDKDDHCPPKYGFCPCPPSKDDDCECDTPSCDTRPVAYRAPLLYELINDADVDLSRIETYSWADWALGDWNKRMPVDVFEAYVLACVAYPNGQHENQSGAPGFVVKFTKPVDPDTLHPLSVLFELYVRENEYDAEFDMELAINWKHYRVPVAIEPILDHRDRIYAIGARICPKKNWWSHAERLIKQCASEGQLARAEITFRGQMIRDKCGCMLDARPPELTCRDHCGDKTGQARPGQDWSTVFRIGGDKDCDSDDARPEKSKDDTRPNDEPNWPTDPKNPETDETRGETNVTDSRNGEAS